MSIQKKSVLMVVTGHATMGDAHPTGIWFEEYAEPYRAFRESGYDVAIASINGGPAPVDPRSLPGNGDYTKELSLLQNTANLAELKLEDYDAIFFPGGHGTMYDLPNSKLIGDSIAQFMESGRVVAAVCHGPAALVSASFSDGTPVVHGRRVTAFTNNEETAAELHEVVPFLLESRLSELGAEFVGAENWSDHVIVDGNLITGQNPQSSTSAAHAVIDILRQ